MKIQQQAITGFAVGAIITIGALLLFIPRQSTPAYGSCKLDGNILKTMYNGDFKSLVLNFQYSSATNRFDLAPSIYNAQGGNAPVDRQLLSLMNTTRTFAGDRTLVPYVLEQNRVSGLLQLQALVSIVASNPGCSFTLNADDYSTIDPRDLTHICYRIMPYTSRGEPISVRGIDARVFVLNPSPPGRRY